MHVRASFQARGFCVVSGWETFKDWGACGEARGSLLILKTPTNLSRIGGCSKHGGKMVWCTVCPDGGRSLTDPPPQKTRLVGSSAKRGIPDGKTLSHLPP